MNPFRKILLLIFLIIFVFSFSTTPISAKTPIRTVEGMVIKVSDGDTLQVKTSEATKLKIRLYGIDAPETEKINHRTGHISKSGQPYGEEAYKALESKVLGKKVRVVIIDTDKYKRMVGIVYLENRNINIEMIWEGWARAYREYLDRPYASQYLDAEKEARNKRLGLWKQGNPQPPWEFRKLMRIR